MAAPTVRSSSSVATDANSLTITVPAPSPAPQDGDVLVGTFSFDIETAGVAQIIAMPAGFTHPTGWSDSQQTDNLNVNAGVKTARGESGDYQYSYTHPGGGAAGERGSGAILVIANTSGVNAAAEIVTQTSTTTHTAPEVTTTVDDCLIVYIVVADSATTSISDKGGLLTEVVELGSTTSGTRTWVGHTVQAIAGTTPERKFDLNTSDQAYLRTVAFAPDLWKLQTVMVL